MEIQDKIDHYLMGQMSHEEQLSFEQELTSNPNLQQEVNVQKDIVNAIQETKRLEFKKRLSSLDVGASTSSFNFKPWFIGFSLTSLAVLGTFGIWEVTKTDKTVIDETINNSPIVETIPSTTENINTTIPITTVESTKAIEEPIVDIIEQPVIDKKVVSNVKTTEKITDPSDHLPTFGTEHEGIENITHGTHETVSTNSLEMNEDLHIKESLVPTIKKDKNMFHYEYDGEKLALIGDFESDKPYTLFELQHEEGSPLYLLFENNFYSIKNTGGKKQQLDLVTDKKILSQLKSK